MTCALLEGVSWIEGRVLEGRDGQRSRSRPCIDLCGNHDHNRVSKGMMMLCDTYQNFFSNFIVLFLILGLPFSHLATGGNSAQY